MPSLVDRLRGGCAWLAGLVSLAAAGSNRHESRPRVLAALLVALGMVFGLDALLFRAGIYRPFLDPNSSAGNFENVLAWERDFQARSAGNVVVMVGHSRFGFMPRVANEMTPRPDYVFRSAAVAGASPRTWYYLLRDLDPGASRYRAIVIGADDYADEDTMEDPAEDTRDLHYAVARLRMADVIEFASSFRTPQRRWQAFRGSLLKGLVLQQDIQAFLSQPLARIEDARSARQDGGDWAYNWEGDPESLAGLEIDWANWKAKFPPGASQLQRESVQDFLLRPAAPQNGRVAEFRRVWFRRIADRYRTSRTKIIFLRLARGPIPRPEHLVRKNSSSIREMAGLPHVLLADEHAFESLERPELYKGGLHLNREGSARFSRMLAAEIGRVLGPPESPRRN